MVFVQFSTSLMIPSRLRQYGLRARWSCCEGRGAPRSTAGRNQGWDGPQNWDGDELFRWGILSKIRINITKQVDVWVKLRCNQSASDQQEEPYIYIYTHTYYTLVGELDIFWHILTHPHNRAPWSVPRHRAGPPKIRGDEEWICSHGEIFRILYLLCNRGLWSQKWFISDYIPSGKLT